MRGISMSSVSTSGESALILSRAMIGSGAVPTTSIDGSRPRSSVNSCRISAESSMMSTLIGTGYPPSDCSNNSTSPGRRRCGRVRPKRVSAAAIRAPSAGSSLTKARPVEGM